MEHIHFSTFDTSNVVVAHNLRSCSRPPSETKTKTKTSKSGLVLLVCYSKSADALFLRYSTAKMP